MHSLLNKVTVNHNKRHIEFIFKSDTAREASNAFNEICHIFDCLGYNPSPFILDSHGNRLAKLIKIRTRNILAEYVNNILGFLFNLFVVLFLFIYFLIFYAY